MEHYQEAQFWVVNQNYSEASCTWQRIHRGCIETNGLSVASYYRAVNTASVDIWYLYGAMPRVIVYIQNLAEQPPSPYASIRNHTEEE